MNEAIYNAINLGAPTFSNIRISFDELRLIASDKDLLEENINKIHSKVWSKVHYNGKLGFHRIGNVDDECLSTGKIDKNFVDGILVATSSKDSISHVLLDPFDFFLELQKILNVPGNLSININDTNLRNRLNARINLLKNITSLDKLKEEFPVLYEDYQKGNILFSKISELKGQGNDELLNELNEKYKRCGLRYIVSYFTERQAFIYNRFVNNFDEFVNICIKDDGRLVKKEIINNTDYLSGVDANKLSLLICYKYIKKAKETEDFNSYQSALFYILPVLSNNDMRKVNFDIDGVHVDYEYIKREYIDMNIKFANLVPYNANRASFLGKTKEQSLKKIEEELNLYEKLKREIYVGVSNQNGATTYKKGPSVAISRDGKDYEELNRLYERKIQLLETDEYMEKFLTQEGFDGYIYFVYPNGIILREKYFKNFAKYILADDEAMYKSDINSFFKVHNLSKPDLIHTSNDVVKRIYHAGDFESRARNFITLPYSDDDVKKSEEFIAKVKKKELLIPTKNKKLF